MSEISGFDAWTIIIMGGSLLLSASALPVPTERDADVQALPHTAVRRSLPRISSFRLDDSNVLGETRNGLILNVFDRSRRAVDQEDSFDELFGNTASEEKNPVNAYADNDVYNDILLVANKLTSFVARSRRDATQERQEKITGFTNIKG